MFQITDIKTAEHHVKIIFDTGEYFILSLEVFNMYTVRKGKSVDTVEYQQLKEESERYLCNKKAVDYLSAADRSRLEIENYLARKGFSKNIIKEIIIKLNESGYINDYKFALNYIHYKKSRKAVGENLLRHELFKKGVSKNFINIALSESSAGSDDTESLYQLALKKIKSLGTKKNKESKLIFFLKQRGFHDKDIRTVINNLKSDGQIDEPV